jgi:hypothetical protein
MTYSSKQIMSPENYLQIHFKYMRKTFLNNSMISGLKFGKGFSIRYSFISDYGLIERNDTSIKDICAIEFHSSVRREGIFSSPNYPGLYPRSTTCKYFFYGNQSEKVQITFHTFDIEGVNQ